VSREPHPGSLDADEPVREPADIVAEAALACAAVAGLDDSGIVTTFLPGRRVSGVVLRDDVCEVSVVLRWDGSTPLPELAEAVRQAVVPVAGGRRVDVVVADVVVPDSPGRPGTAAEPSGAPAAAPVSPSP
jgi:hypothetical protein